MHALTSARRWPFVRRGLGGRTAIQCSRLRQPIEQHVDVHEAGVRPCITGRCLIALGHIDPQPEQAIEQMPQAPPVDVGSRAWADRLDEQRAPSTNPFGGQSLPQRAERVPLLRIVTEPLAQLRAGTDILQPGVGSFAFVRPRGQRRSTRKRLPSLLETRW
jgi:hypothetical protein